MKRKLICIFFLLFVLCSCQNDEAVIQDELTVQSFNEMFDRRLSSYYDKCKRIELDAFCDDVFESADKPVKYVYRAIQFVMFDIVEEDGFAKSGIYNYDVCLYEDGTAEMVYRHGVEDGITFFIDKNVRFEMSEEELNTFKNALTENDFENIPTWNPEEPEGMDGETTYIFGMSRVSCHLATRWVAPEGDAVYQIRSTMEQIAGAHIG